MTKDTKTQKTKKMQISVFVMDNGYVIRTKNHETSKVVGFLGMSVGCPDKIHLCWKKCNRRDGAKWARAANLVKKPLLIVNGTYLKLNGFNESMWVSWSPSNSNKSQCIDRCIQIHQIYVNKHGYYSHIKFEVSLQFWPIWPTVRRRCFWSERRILRQCLSLNLSYFFHQTALQSTYTTQDTVCSIGHSNSVADLILCATYRARLGRRGVPPPA